MTPASPKAPLIGAVILAALLPFASGCLKGSFTLDINRDRSGSFEANYAVSETAISQISSLIQVSRQLEALSSSVKRNEQKEDIMLFLNPDETRLRQLISRYEKDGVRLDKLKIRSKDSRRSVDLRVEFTDIVKLAKTDFFPDIGFSLYRKPSGDYIFFRKNLASEQSSADILKTPEMQRLINPFLSGMEVSVKLRAPGRILQTNAHNHGLKSATWIFEHDKNPGAFEALQKQEYIAVIDGSELSIPDIRIVKAK